MQPDGVLAIHVSNRYLDLAPVVQRSGAGGWKTGSGGRGRGRCLTGDRGKNTWMLVTANETFVSGAKSYGQVTGPDARVSRLDRRLQQPDSGAEAVAGSSFPVKAGARDCPRV